MSFAKFVSLLDTQALYFAQAGTLAARDPFEGRYGGQNYAFAKRMEEDLEFAKEILGAQHSEQVIRAFQGVMGSAGLRTGEKLARALSYVNCWSSSEFESAALWSVYAQESEGVAIKSTVGALRSALAGEQASIYIGRIRYIDFKDGHIEVGNLFHQVFAKRMSFSFETEVRACLLLAPEKGITDEELNKLPSGVLAKCDVEKLIDEVYVAPFSPRWFHGLVNRIVQKYGLTKKVIRSSITDESIV